MKKMITRAAVAFSAAIFMSSCYSYTSVVGNGGTGQTKVTKWNSYLIGGLIPVGVSDSKAMAGGATDYTVTTKHSFVNMLVGGLTFGFYQPTTTIVKK
ncbi:Bor family protein [Flavobacterium sp. MAHUQ-51]|uniref:Bor family protein n=1 Tax=Flavobacterium sp. GCM10022190 TaxID=3252639 RepID=UPI00361607F8